MRPKISTELSYYTIKLRSRRCSNLRCPKCYHRKLKTRTHTAVLKKFHINTSQKLKQPCQWELHASLRASSLVDKGGLEEVIARAGRGEDQHQHSRVQVDLLHTVRGGVRGHDAGEHARDQDAGQDHHRVRSHDSQEQESVHHTHCGDRLGLVQRAQKVARQHDDQEHRAEGLQAHEQRAPRLVPEADDLDFVGRSVFLLHRGYGSGFRLRTRGPCTDGTAGRRLGSSGGGRDGAGTLHGDGSQWEVNTHDGLSTTPNKIKDVEIRATAFIKKY